MRKLKIAIPFTPHTPHRVRVLAVLMVALTTFCPISYSQSRSMVSLDSLSRYEQSYRQYVSQKWQAERQEFIITTRKKWWYYLPNIGYAFGGPSIHTNTGVLAQIDNDRAVLAARLVSLDSRYQVEFVEMLARIRVEYQKLKVRSQQLERERGAMKRLYAIHAIYTEAFNKQTMSPEESLKHAYELDKAINELQNRDAELALSVLDFMTLCRYGMPDTKLVRVDE
jgi:hypothetical protein